MHLVYGLMFLSGAYPLWLAWRGNRRTTLLQAVNWSAAAWLGWVGMVALNGQGAARGEMARYLALCLTGCAGVAVLGARRPGVGAWNFVVLGLLAVMLLPVGQWLVLGGRPLDVVRLLVPAGTVAVAALNYLPTRLAPGALLLGTGCGWELVTLGEPSLAGEWLRPGWLCVAAAPWAAWLNCVVAPPPAAEFDRLWLGFRNRFGLVWGQRVREQFNRAAANAGWPVQLYWQGLALLAGSAAPEQPTQEEIVQTLRLLLRRFHTDAGEDTPPAAAYPRS
jgi:hypothetical protein